MSIKIESTIEEIQNWINEEEIYDLLKSFNMINDLYVKTDERFVFNMKDHPEKNAYKSLTKKEVKMTTWTNFDSFYEESYAA